MFSLSFPDLKAQSAQWISRVIFCFGKDSGIWSINPYQFACCRALQGKEAVPGLFLLLLAAYKAESF